MTWLLALTRLPRLPSLSRPHCLLLLLVHPTSLFDHDFETINLFNTLSPTAIQKPACGATLAVLLWQRAQHLAARRINAAATAETSRANIAELAAAQTAATIRPPACLMKSPGKGRFLMITPPAKILLQRPLRVRVRNALNSQSSRPLPLTRPPACLMSSHRPVRFLMSFCRHPLLFSAFFTGYRLFSRV